MTRSHDGRYAGCAWFFIALWLVVLAYLGLDLAGPSALPSVLLTLGIAFGALVLAVALWRGIGGRRLAGTSLVFGVALAVLVFMSNSDQSAIGERFGGALFGVAVALASAFALRARQPLAPPR